MRAIIVDDSRAMRAMIRDVLNRARYQVLEAAGEAAALEALVDFRPVDLAIVDWSLPRNGGLEFVREVRRRPEWASMWLIMMTLGADSSLVLEGLRAGADDWLVKPFTRQALLLKVARLHNPQGKRQ